jgi:multidrug efflux pump subunit AcrA (membrane-fusion protein)
VDPGSAIFPGSPFFVVESAGNLQVSANIPTAQSKFLELGLKVRIRDEGQKTMEVMGEMSEIVPQSDPRTHTIRFKVDLPPDFSPPPGHFLKVIVPAGERKTILVPRSALRTAGQLTGVFVLDNASIARFRLVKTSDFDENRVEILTGILEGEKIVSQPSTEIVDGTPLEVQP